MEKIIIGTFVAVAIFGIGAIAAFFLMWAWNLFMPVVWHAAPHIGFWHAMAAEVLLASLRGIFYYSNNTTKVKR